LYTAQKSNSHYAPQPYINKSVFKSLLNCTSEISLAVTCDRQRVPETRSSDGKTPVSETRSCFLWHTSRRQPIAVIGGRCRSRANNLQPGTVATVLLPVLLSTLPILTRISISP